MRLRAICAGHSAEYSNDLRASGQRLTVSRQSCKGSSPALSLVLKAWSCSGDFNSCSSREFPNIRHHPASPEDSFLTCLRHFQIPFGARLRKFFWGRSGQGSRLYFWCCSSSHTRDDCSHMPQSQIGQELTWSWA